MKRKKGLVASVPKEKQIDLFNKQTINIINAIGDPIFVKDERSIFIYVNDALCKILGLTREDIIGKTLGESLPADQMEHFLKVDKMVIETGVENICQETLTGRDGKILDIVTRKTRYINEEGNRILVGVIRDVTEHQRLKENAMQSEKMAAVGKLASGVAHEINNPLTAILGYCQLLLKKTVEDSMYYKPLTVIEKQTVRCKVLVEQLLLFSRMQKSAFCEVDLNKTVEEIIQIVQTKSKVSDVELLTEFDPGVLPIFGSKNQLQQVVANLCNNALDAVPKGGRVWVRTKHFKGYALLEVEDNGIGVPDNIKNQIFEPFFTTKEVGKGTGLGLSLTFEILKKHGFEIALESEDTKGAKFIVKMPYKTESVKAEGDT